MYKSLVLSLLLQAIVLTSLGQLKIVEKTLTDLHVTSNNVTGMVRQADGKIIILGAVADGQKYSTALLRFDSTGTLDNSFGTNGVDTFNVPDYFKGYEAAYINTIALQGDKILLGGGSIFSSSGITQGNAILMRFTSNGAVDSSFGTNGVVITNAITSTGISIDEIKSIFIDGNSRIVVAGRTDDYQKNSFLVARYTPSGHPDVSFNTNGVKLIGVGTKDDQALDVAVYPGGRIVVLGKTYTDNNNYEIALVALKNNGAPDSAFGNKGIVKSSVSAGPDIANRLIIQADKKILCTGNSNSNIVALRYKQNGNPDSSFGTNGVSVINLPVAWAAIVNSMTLQPDGKIVVGGFAVKNSVTNFFVSRLTGNGGLDIGFANYGFSFNSVYNENDAAYAMCVTPGGSILQGGKFSRNGATLFGVLKYAVNGTLDKSFAKKGIKSLGIGTSRDVAFKMLRLPWDNSFLLCGTANGLWSLLKYQANKSLRPDRAFGIDGVRAVPYSYDGDQFAEPNVAVDSALQKIYMCGLVYHTLYIFRFNSDGTTDSSFGSNGIVQYPNVSLYYGGLAVTANHQVVFGGIRQSGISGYSFVAMLKKDGTPNPFFGNNGEVRHIKVGVHSVLINNYNNTIRVAGMISVNDFMGGIGIVSLHSNGDYDSSFGKNGLARLKIKGASTEPYFKYSLAQDEYGRMVVSGSVMSYDFGGYWFSVSRFTKNGVPDSSFGTNGIVMSNPATGVQTNPANEGISTGCIDKKHCYIVTAGTEMDSYFKTAKSIVAVYKSDGSVDSVSTTSAFWDRHLFGGTYESAYAVFIDNISSAGYTLYVAGTGGKVGGQDFALVKLEKQIPGVQFQSLALDGKVINPLGIYPNPVHSSFTLTYMGMEKGPVNIQLVDVNGRLMQQYQFNAYGDGGLFTKTLQLPAGMAGGVYFVKLSNGKNVFVERLVKQ